MSSQTSGDDAEEHVTRQVGSSDDKTGVRHSLSYVNGGRTQPDHIQTMNFE